MKRRLPRDCQDGIVSPIRKRQTLSQDVEDRARDSSFSAAEVETLDYEPTAFIRCHSQTRADAADVSTQVWQCAFEPDVNKPDSNTNYVATCGGNSVCLIDVHKGKVFRQYYATEFREKFYSLCWTTVIGQKNVLAVGGAMGTIHLIHPDTDTVFVQHKLPGFKRAHFISTLLFDKLHPHILYCGTSDGRILIFDIGHPRPPHYVKSIALLHTLQTSSELFVLAQCISDQNTLLAGSNDGLVGWQMPRNVTASMKSPPQLRFNFPYNESADLSYTRIVDSVVALRNGIVATKCALHGVVYVWDVAETFRNGSTQQDWLDVVPRHTLRWSDTDNYFMNMGYSDGSGLLCCGDDKGMLWLYDMLALDSAKATTGLVEPTALLQWPEVDDRYIELQRKLRLDVYDIVVDKVSIDSSGEYIVAVTANNMVCIWRRL